VSEVRGRKASRDTGKLRIGGDWHANWHHCPFSEQPAQAHCGAVYVGTTGARSCLDSL
jgi:hypothetical protein